MRSLTAPTLPRFGCDADRPLLASPLVSGHRIVLQPRAQPVEAGLGVLGAELRLERSGPSATFTASGERPATLRFLAGYLASSRPPAEPEFVEFASVAVRLRIDETGAAVVTLDAEADYVYEDRRVRTPSREALNTRRGVNSPNLPTNRRLAQQASRSCTTRCCRIRAACLCKT